MVHFNPLNTELNPICHLLALLGVHHILHVSRVSVDIVSNAPTFCMLLLPCLPIKQFAVSSWIISL